jgi:hypothetical protein
MRLYERLHLQRLKKQNPTRTHAAHVRTQAARVFFLLEFYMFFFRTLYSRLLDADAASSTQLRMGRL